MRVVSIVMIFSCVFNSLYLLLPYFLSNQRYGRKNILLYSSLKEEAAKLHDSLKKIYKTGKNQDYQLILFLSIHISLNLANYKSLQSLNTLP